MRHIMNKRGFTLIELIGVIILLAAVALISTPIINNIIKKTKEKAYTEQINTILAAAKKYVSENDVSSTDRFKIRIVSDLVANYYLEDDDIKDPRDEIVLTDLNSWIYVDYDARTKSYSYIFCREGENGDKPKCKE